MKKLRCGECPMDTTIVLDRTSGDTICTECGLVLEQNYIDDTPEWRSFKESAHNPGRVGHASNPLMEDAGLLTSVNNISTKRSDNNKVLGASWHKHEGTTSSKNLVEAFKDIEILAGRLNLNKVIQDQANEIFTRATTAKLARGVNQIAKVAACIYLACQQLNVPRTYREMEHAAPKANCKSIGRATKQIQRGLQEEHQELMKKAIMKPEDQVRRFASQLGLESSDSRAVQEIVKSCSIHIMDVKRTPNSVLAAVIYMAMRIQNKGEKPLAILEDAVAKATDTSVSTLKGTYKKLLTSAEEIVPSWYADKEEMKYLG